jgi:hypothetical protein
MTLKLLFTFFAVVFVTTLNFAQTTTDQSSFRAGRYEGRAYNTTAKQSGSVIFELYDLDSSSRKVRAYAGFSNGLEGESWLVGKITPSGELDLSGDLSNYRMTIDGKQNADGTITAQYQLKGDNPQEGNFNVTFRSSVETSAPEALFGAWEVGGALPAMTNPVTGFAGVSFVDAHRLEFFPDATFKHLWSHRHCDGATCCSEQAMLEEGTYKMTGDDLALTISSGELINRDRCNPRMNGQTPVKHRTETFTVSGRGSQLCLRQGSQAPACYQKQS